MKTVEEVIAYMEAELAEAYELHGESKEGRKCPEYLLKLMKYKLEHEGFIK